jgi:NADPH2:quinone reductase
MPGAIRINSTGGPEKLIWEDVPVAVPKANEVLVRNTAIGINFLDVYHRTGLYPMQLPFTPGMEGAGIIEAVGPKVKGLKKGMRVAYADPIGAYAEMVIRPADRLVKIPEGISDKIAAAIMLKGMTAEYLLRRTYKVKAGDTILVHAAAGGVGQILCQWAKHLGATVIGTVGNLEKVKVAKKVGCKHVIISSQQSIPDEVKRITKGKGVCVVYDGVGKDTFEQSLDCLMPRGLMVSYGNASGPVSPFSINNLSKKGSLFLTRPSLFTYNASHDDLTQSAKALFAVVKNGKVKISVNQTYALKDAAQAHRDLEDRKTTGSSVFLI